MQSTGTQRVSPGLRDPSKVTWFKSLISWKKQTHSSHAGEGSSWSHSRPCCHKCCILILAQIRKAAANPTGSNIWAICLSTALLVRKTSFRGFMLNRKRLLSWFQTLPSVFPCVSQIFSGFSFSMISFCKGRFESYPLTWKPPFSDISSSLVVSHLACWMERTESQMSSL